MNRRTNLIVLALAVGIACGVTARPASAITVIPTSLEKTTDPDKVISTKVTLFNESSATVTFTTSTANFTAKDEYGTPDFKAETDQSDLAGWINLDRGPFTLLPGDEMELPLTITVPALADPGGHYATAFFNVQNASGTENASGVTVNMKVGMNILLRVTGDITESAQLSTFESTDGSNAFNRLPVSFTARVINNGNTHIRPIGTVTIRNLFGGTTATLPFNATQGAVLPSSARKYDVVWEKDTPTGTSTFISEFANEWNNFALGPYTAELSLTYGNTNDKVLTQSYKFYVFPWRILTLGLIIIVLLVWLIIFSVKRYNHWIVVRAAQGKTKNGDGETSSKRMK